MATGTVRVLVVDDSAFMRFAIAKYLEADPYISVIGSARDGLDALDKIKTLKPDVVTLDVEMPRMDGLTALRRIMAESPTPVIMFSSLTRRGADATIRALMRGAVDFMLKPTTGTDVATVAAELSRKIKTAARTSTKAAPAPPPASQTETVPSKLGPRPFRPGDRLVVIGASTGGPRSLQQVLSRLPADLPAAVTIVQHMPPGFTQSLAHRLNEESPLTVQEATNGDRIARGLALVARGDYHMLLNQKRVVLDQGPPRHFVRPAVDATMESAAQQYGANVLGVVLTGMGSDGTEGAGSIKAYGGKIIAEHQSTTVVYGMPRSVVEAGHADWVVPLGSVADKITALVKHNGHAAS